MPDIKYVCLSDMHFGAQNSLLTKLAPDGLKPNFLEPSPVLIALVENLRSLVAENQDIKQKPLHGHSRDAGPRADAGWQDLAGR